MLNIIELENKYIALAGDWNLNLIQPQNKYVSAFSNLLASWCDKHQLWHISYVQMRPNVIQVTRWTKVVQFVHLLSYMHFVRRNVWNFLLKK